MEPRGEHDFAAREMEEGGEYRYAAFVSYRHTEPDRHWAEWLHRALETYRVPARLVRERGVTSRVGRVFRDEEELPAAADLSSTIDRALQESRFLIVVCSPRTPGSEWVNREVERFREMGRHDRILALLVEGEPGESFPRSLREIRRTLADSAGLAREEIEQVEPLAADVRTRPTDRSRGLRRLARLRLLACILGCRFDDLRRREHERQVRRLVVGGTLMGVLLTLMVGLTALTLYQSHRATIMTSLALEHGQSALAERGKAEAAAQQERLAKESAQAAALQEQAAKTQAEAAARKEQEARTQAEAERVRALAAAQKEREAREQADTARKKEEEANRQAERRRYGSAILLAREAWDQQNNPRLQEILEALRPERTEGKDFRGFEWHYWARQAQRELLAVKARGGIVYSVCMSPDGTRVAAGSGLRPRETFIQIWDTRTGEELHTLQGHETWVECLRFSPDGKRLASASADHTVRIWDVASGKSLLTFAGHDRDVVSISFSPDGKRIASVGVNGAVVKVWDAANGRELASFKPDTNGSVFGVCFSRDGKYLACGSVSGVIKMWDLARNTEHAFGKDFPRLMAPIDSLGSVCFSPDGKRMVGGSQDKTVTLWDTQTMRELASFSVHRARLCAMAFSPDGERLVSAGERPGSITVRDAENGRELLTLKGNYRSANAFGFSPDGKCLVTGGEDSMVRLWDARISGEASLRAKETSPLDSVCVSSDGKRLVGTGSNGTATVWDIAGRQVLLTLQRAGGNAVFSPDGKRLASGAADGALMLWDADGKNPPVVIKGHKGRIPWVCFSPDGTRLASAGSDHSIKLWDAASGAAVRSLKGHKDTVTSICFSPDGRQLASTGLDKTLKVSDVSEGRELISIQAPERSVCFSPDGKLLASTGLNDSSVRLRNAASGEDVLTLKGHNSIVQDVCFSPDGQRIATAGHTGAKLWDVATGQELLHLPGIYTASSVCFSPDGHRLFVGAYGVVSIWDATPVRPRLPK